MGLVMSRPKYVTDPQHILGCADAHIVGIVQMTWFAVLNELQHLFRRVRVKTYRAAYFAWTSCIVAGTATCRARSSAS